MTSITNVLVAARRLVTPSASLERKMRAMADEMLARVTDASSRFPEVRGVHLGGSYAKGTWLPKDVDLDIFVRFAREVDDSTFETVGLAIGEEAVRGYPHGKKYAQHPYTEASVDGIKVNVVPCYDVRPGSWKSAADRSLFHVEFVNERMSKAGKHQVRLLKRFMRTVGVYGAEIEKEGFSGYASEVLVLEHGGFEEALRYFSKLSFVRGNPFSLKDPVDPNRELATAVSGETVARMVLASRAFLTSPDVSYFRSVTRKKRRKLVGNLYCITFEHPLLSEDTLWGELKKSTRQLVKHVENEGFRVVRSTAISNDIDRSAIVLLPESDELPPLVQRAGPSVDLQGEVKRFLSKNKEKVELVWVADDGRLHVLQRRRYTRLEALLRELRGESVRRLGLSRDIALAIERTGKVLTGAEVEHERSVDEWFREGIDSVVSDTIGTDSAR